MHTYAPIPRGLSPLRRTSSPEVIKCKHTLLCPLFSCGSGYILSDSEQIAGQTAHPTDAHGPYATGLIVSSICQYCASDTDAFVRRR